jgi:hypothetical protein
LRSYRWASQASPLLCWCLEHMSVYERLSLFMIIASFGICIVLMLTHFLHKAILARYLVTTNNTYKQWSVNQFLAALRFLCAGQSRII